MSEKDKIIILERKFGLMSVPGIMKIQRKHLKLRLSKGREENSWRIVQAQ